MVKVNSKIDNRQSRGTLKPGKSKRMLIMWKSNSPKKLFLLLMLGLYALFTVIDVLAQTTDGPNWLDLGNLLLAQILAVLITTATVAFGLWKRQIKTWMALSVVSITSIVASFTVFYVHPRIPAEADGPATVRYTCMISERYSTVSGLFGEASDYHSVTAKVCVLKNLHVAASNMLFIKNDATLSGTVIFCLYELFFAAVALGVTRMRYFQ